jgi:hypothetical protein
MTIPVASLIEKLLATPCSSVEEAGRTLLDCLSSGSVSPETFLENPSLLVSAEGGATRYLAQVTWRALKSDYESVDEVLTGLHGVLDRDPPVLRSRTRRSGPQGLHVIPEVRILRVPRPEARDGSWDLRFEAQVTSGELENREIHVQVSSAVNATAARIVPYFWVHASVSLYNLKRVDTTRFEALPETFFVLEPLRQVNATAVARSLDCPKPQVDQIRRSRGDVTVHTVKGMIVHAILDRLIAGEDDVDAAYDAVQASYLVQLAAIADDGFDEDGFRAEVLRHGRALKEFVVLNPHMRRDPQVELRRYSATIGIQGRIDAVFRTGDRLDLVELKTGKRIRREDHAQLFIYRLLLTDFIRRARTESGRDIELTARLLSSCDGTSTPLRFNADFHAVLAARNRLLAHSYALGRGRTHLTLPYAGYDAAVCGQCVSWTASRCREDSALFGDGPDSNGEPDRDTGEGDPAAAALEYFMRFSRLVQHESWQAGQDLADLLDDSRLGLRQRQFRTICRATCTGRAAGGFRFTFDENGSDIGPGDQVLVHSGRISSTPAFHGYVKSVDRTHAEIAIPLYNMTERAFGAGEWTIDRFPSDYTAQSSQTGLYDFLRSSNDERKRVILGVAGAGVAAAGSRLPSRERFDGPFDAELNAGQVRAVQAALEAPVFHLIWGPPGTGKTRVVAEIIAAIRSRDETPGGVLLGAFTNTALDTMLLSLLDRDPDAEFLRIGRSLDSPELTARLGSRAASCFSEDMAASSAGAVRLRRRMDRMPVVAATAHRASTHPYLRSRTFGLTLVDEAAQLTEPLSLGLVMRAKRFVLIGDDFQLPPVVRAQRLGVSMFERLKQTAERESGERLSLLNVQYRMHPQIMDVSNRLFYRGRLSSGVTSEDRCPPFGSPLAFVRVDTPSEGRTNAAEAEAVRAIVDSLVDSIAPESIGVISPFRAQVVVLRRVLADTGVVADTVERFQGGERDVIVVSLVRCRGSEFVFDDRRFNVAITRARRKLILVAHPELFRNTKYEWLSGLAGP